LSAVCDIKNLGALPQTPAGEIISPAPLNRFYKKLVCNETQLSHHKNVREALIKQASSGKK